MRTHVGQFLARLLKANLWEVSRDHWRDSAVFAAADRSEHVRPSDARWGLCLMVHLGISYAFNFAFVLGLPNAAGSVDGDDRLSMLGRRASSGSCPGAS